MFGYPAWTRDQCIGTALTVLGVVVFITDRHLGVWALANLPVASGWLRRLRARRLLQYLPAKMIAVRTFRSLKS